MKAEILTGLLQVQKCPPISSIEFFELIIQLAVNTAVLLVISRILYYRWNRKPEYLFAQLISGTIVFVICALLRWVKLELGLVLGLFAIFSIIRFRTINVPVKDMAYLFMVAGISAVNALLPVSSCIQWIVISNTMLVLMTLILEKKFFSRPVSSRNIIWDNVELLKPDKYNMLLQELCLLTGLKIIRFEIGKTDYIKKHAQIRIYFLGSAEETISEDNVNDDD